VGPTRSSASSRTLRVPSVMKAELEPGGSGFNMRAENTVHTISFVCDNDHDPRSSQPPPGPVGPARDDYPRAWPQTMLTVLTPRLHVAKTMSARPGFRRRFFMGFVLTQTRRPTALPTKGAAGPGYPRPQMPAANFNTKPTPAGTF